ncbi:MAG: hypothetical protein ACPGSN_01150 [Psychrobium sp.]
MAVVWAGGNSGLITSIPACYNFDASPGKLFQDKSTETPIEFEAIFHLENRKDFDKFNQNKARFNKFKTDYLADLAVLKDFFFTHVFNQFTERNKKIQSNIEIFENRLFPYAKKNYFQIIMYGSPRFQIYQIALLIGHPTIADDFKQQVLEELFLGVDSCVGGVQSRIDSCCSKLIRYLQGFEGALQTVCEEVVTAEAVNYFYSHQLAPIYEIHVVNALKASLSRNHGIPLSCDVGQQRNQHAPAKCTAEFYKLFALAMDKKLSAMFFIMHIAEKYADILFELLSTKNIKADELGYIECHLLDAEVIGSIEFTVMEPLKALVGDNINLYSLLPIDEVNCNRLLLAGIGFRMQRLFWQSFSSHFRRLGESVCTLSRQQGFIKESIRPTAEVKCAWKNLFWVEEAGEKRGLTATEFRQIALKETEIELIEALLLCVEISQESDAIVLLEMLLQQQQQTLIVIFECNHQLQLWLLGLLANNVCVVKLRLLIANLSLIQVKAIPNWLADVSQLSEIVNTERLQRGLPVKPVYLLELLVKGNTLDEWINKGGNLPNDSILELLQLVKANLTTDEFERARILFGHYCPEVLLLSLRNEKYCEVTEALLRHYNLPLILPSAEHEKHCFTSEPIKKQLAISTLKIVEASKSLLASTSISTKELTEALNITHWKCGNQTVCPLLFQLVIESDAINAFITAIRKNELLDLLLVPDLNEDVAWLLQHTPWLNGQIATAKEVSACLIALQQMDQSELNLWLELADNISHEALKVAVIITKIKTGSLSDFEVTDWLCQQLHLIPEGSLSISMPDFQSRLLLSALIYRGCTKLVLQRLRVQPYMDETLLWHPAQNKWISTFPLHYAVEHQQQDVVISLITSNPEFALLVRKRDLKTALHCIVLTNLSVECIQLLMTNSDVNKLDKNAKSPLELSLQNHSSQNMLVLLSCLDVDMFCKMKNGKPLFLLIDKLLSQRQDIVDLMIIQRGREQTLGLESILLKERVISLMSKRILNTKELDNFNCAVTHCESFHSVYQVMCLIQQHDVFNNNLIKQGTIRILSAHLRSVFSALERNAVLLIVNDQAISLKVLSSMAERYQADLINNAMIFKKFISKQKLTFAQCWQICHLVEQSVFQGISQTVIIHHDSWDKMVSCLIINNQQQQLKFLLSLNPAYQLDKDHTLYTSTKELRLTPIAFARQYNADCVQSIVMAMSNQQVSVV